MKNLFYNCNRIFGLNIEECFIKNRLLKSPKQSNIVKHFKRKHEEIAKECKTFLEPSKNDECAGSLNKSIVKLLIEKNAPLSYGDKILIPFLNLLKKHSNEFKNMEPINDLTLSRRSVVQCT
ncbi:hypothetical protein SNEBB_000240, partial [Seison nebaliae]